MVNVSRDENAPLHNEFEWDDSVAAEGYRENQARHIINCLVIQPDVEEAEPIRAFFKVEERSNNYESIEKIFAHKESKEALFKTALNELKAFKVKYQCIEQFAKIFDEINKLSA